MKSDFYNIFEEWERGAYTPGFFLMKVSFPFDPNDLSSLSTEDLGTFAHEYVHFLQNTSTPFGLWQAMIFYQIISEYFSFVHGTKVVELPVEGYVISDTMQKRIDIENEASGFRGFIDTPEGESLNYKRELVGIHGKTIERVSLRFKDIHGISRDIILGANTIKESMAAMVQELIHPDSQMTHKAIPYKVVERLAKQLAPNIKDDIKKLIALCFISLHTLSPGITLLNYLGYANDNPDKDILAIFEHFLSDSQVLKNDGTQMSVEKLCDDIVEAFKQDTHRFLFGKNQERQLIYLAEIVDRVKISAGMVPLLRLLVENDIDANLIQTAVNACGTPIIWNDYGNISIPNTIENENGVETPDMELIGLVAYQSLYKRLSDDRQLVCPMYPICNNFMNSLLKDECYELPWLGNTCIMTTIANSIGLS